MPIQRKIFVIYRKHCRFQKILVLIVAGNIEPSELIVDMDARIAKAKEGALSR
jgi:hypothetical protein